MIMDPVIVGVVMRIWVKTWGQRLVTEWCEVGEGVAELVIKGSPFGPPASRQRSLDEVGGRKKKKRREE